MVVDTTLSPSPPSPVVWSVKAFVVWVVLSVVKNVDVNVVGCTTVVIYPLGPVPVFLVVSTVPVVVGVLEGVLVGVLVGVVDDIPVLLLFGVADGVVVFSEAVVTRVVVVNASSGTVSLAVVMVVVAAVLLWSSVVTVAGFRAGFPHVTTHKQTIRATKTKTCIFLAFFQKNVKTP